MDTNLNYADIDIARANHVVPNVIKNYQANKNKPLSDQSPIDDDVMTWLMKQDEDTKRHIDEVIRHFMAIKHV